MTDQVYPKEQTIFCFQYDVILTWWYVPENVTRWERTVQDGEDELEASRQAEAKQRQDIDRELRRADALKADRTAARAAQDKADEAVTAVSTPRW